eukprot:GGOE01062078.1.p1 GENE.GGOE01062078.1~~GGOE01062078.1.p1  ORF type:complete len:543 (-),score=257.54 GGOE01062078.1:295-1923(-)
MTSHSLQASPAEKVNYFRAMQEKEKRLSDDFQRRRVQNQAVLEELTRSLAERERGYEQLQAELQRRERHFEKFLQDRLVQDQEREERARRERQSDRHRKRSRERQLERQLQADRQRQEEEQRREMERELQSQWAEYQKMVTALRDQHVATLAQQQAQMARALQQSQEEASALLLAHQQEAEGFQLKEAQYEQLLLRLHQELRVTQNLPSPVEAPVITVPIATQTNDEAQADGPSAVDHEQLFIPKPEYEEDFGPTLEPRMFSRVITIFLVIVGGAITTRPSMKEMVAAACYRKSIGLPIRSSFLEAAEFPALAACAVDYSTSDVAVMTEVLRECLAAPSQLVQDLQVCGRFLDYNFTHFWVLLPLVLSWVAPTALALLVVRHDILLLENRRALIPRWMLAVILPWMLTAMVYYVAEPLCNLVLLYRQYADVSGDREVWRNVLPRLFLVFVFWLSLCELFAKLCFSNSSCSLCYLNPLYFTYPKVALSRRNDGLPVLDPQQYENSNPWIVYSNRVALIATFLYGVMVVLLAWFVVPIAFLEEF